MVEQKNKLERATIPMCPRCGEPVEYRTLGRAGNYYVCTNATCLHHCTDPDYGYLAPDISGVVGEIDRVLRDNPCVLRPGVHVITLRDWRDRLSPERKDEDNE